MPIFSFQYLGVGHNPLCGTPLSAIRCVRFTCIYIGYICFNCYTNYSFKFYKLPCVFAIYPVFEMAEIWHIDTVDCDVTSTYDDFSRHLCNFRPQTRVLAIRVFWNNIKPQNWAPSDIFCLNVPSSLQLHFVPFKGRSLKIHFSGSEFWRQSYSGFIIL